MYIPTITIVTPCLNAVGTIDQTIASVVNQAGPFNIHYHIQDGGSTDGTWERVLWWKRHLASTHFIRHCRKIFLTTTQEKDKGLYDAIVKGFEKIHLNSHSFMAWINADDLLFPGALALVADIETQFRSEQASWIGGATALIKENRLISYWDSPRPSLALRHGLCEGTHWEFLQQEGVFFRGWLWKAAAASEWFPKMKLAGDWNLWRIFAHHSTLVQFNYPLGAFRIREGQLSGSQRGKYLEEIDSIISPEDRRRKLEEIVEDGPITRRIGRSNYPNTNIYIYEENIHQAAVERYKKIIGKAPEKNFYYSANKLIFTGDRENIKNKINLNYFSDDNFHQQTNVIAYNSDWQFPAITEKHAYDSIKQHSTTVANSSKYVAFPWATAIDHMQCNSKQAGEWFQILHIFAQKIQEISPTQRLVTVCQHIKMKEYLHLFEACGITDIFWSHCTKGDQNFGDITLHPFPLYPIQYVSSNESKPVRDLLFSYVGTGVKDYYLTETRNWIFQFLQGTPRCFLSKRDSWHYEDAVYNKQIGTKLAAKNPLDTVKKEEEFRSLLSRSIFSLCPSGTGPNSIRLWESLGSGAIPVILADTYLLPGPMELWEEAAVFCPETEEAIASLPAKLETIAKDTALLERKRNAMKQLWLKYGPDCFVYDVLKIMLETEYTTPLDEPSNSRLAKMGVDFLPILAKELLSGRISNQEAGPIIWQGLYTRNRTSSDDLQILIANHPEIIHAAKQTHPFLPTSTRNWINRKGLRKVPGLEIFSAIHS